MTSTFLLLLVVQCLVTAQLVNLSRRYGVGYFSAFFFFFTLLIALPFQLIAADALGLLSLGDVTGREVSRELSISVGGTLMPIVAILVFQIAAILSYGLARRSAASPQPRPWVPVSPQNYRTLAFFLAAFASIYSLARLFVVPDFPLFALLQGRTGRLRDIAFSYASNQKVPFVFLPQINGVVYRVLLPLSGFMLLAVYRSTRRLFDRNLAVVLLASSFVLTIGTFKRAQFLFGLCWVVVYLYATRRPSKRVLSYGLLGVVFVVLMTNAYGPTSDIESAARNALNRTFVVEAVVEFAAIEHYGSTFEHLGADLVARHLDKATGGDSVTFSETWKAQSGGPGARGFAAVGIVGESWVAFGPIGTLLAGVAWGSVLAFGDRRLRDRTSTWRRPFESASITVMGFVATKGVLSQTFSGGLLLLLIFWTGCFILAGSRISHPSRPPSERPGEVEHSGALASRR